MAVVTGVSTTSANGSRRPVPAVLVGLAVLLALLVPPGPAASATTAGAPALLAAGAASPAPARGPLAGLMTTDPVRGVVYATRSPFFSFGLVDVLDSATLQRRQTWTFAPRVTALTPTSDGEEVLVVLGESAEVAHLDPDSGRVRRVVDVGDVTGLDRPGVARLVEVSGVVVATVQPRQGGATQIVGYQSEGELDVRLLGEVTGDGSPATFTATGPLLADPVGGRVVLPGSVGADGRPALVALDLSRRDGPVVARSSEVRATNGPAAGPAALAVSADGRSLLLRAGDVRSAADLVGSDVAVVPGPVRHEYGMPTQLPSDAARVPTATSRTRHVAVGLTRSSAPGGGAADDLTFWDTRTWEAIGTSSHLCDAHGFPVSPQVLLDDVRDRVVWTTAATCSTPLPVATAQGVASDLLGRPVPHARVDLVPPEGSGAEPRRTWADDTGRWSSQVMADVTYEVRASTVDDEDGTPPHGGAAAVPPLPDDVGGPGAPVAVVTADPTSTVQVPALLAEAVPSALLPRGLVDLGPGVLRLPGQPEGLAVDEARELAYVSLPARDEVLVVDLPRRVVLARWPVRSGPGALAVADDGSLLVALRGSGAVAHLDRRDGREVRRTRVAHLTDDSLVSGVVDAGGTVLASAGRLVGYPAAGPAAPVLAAGGIYPSTEVHHDEVRGRAWLRDLEGRPAALDLGRPDLPVVAGTPGSRTYGSVGGAFVATADGRAAVSSDGQVVDLETAQLLGPRVGAGRPVLHAAADQVVVLRPDISADGTCPFFVELAAQAYEGADLAPGHGGRLGVCSDEPFGFTPPHQAAVLPAARRLVALWDSSLVLLDLDERGPVPLGSGPPAPAPPPAPVPTPPVPTPPVPTPPVPTPPAPTSTPAPSDLLPDPPSSAPAPPGPGPTPTPGTDVTPTATPSPTPTPTGPTPTSGTEAGASPARPTPRPSPTATRAPTAPTSPPTTPAPTATAPAPTTTTVPLPAPETSDLGVRRVSGATREETAVAVGRLLPDDRAAVVWLAHGRSAPDALAAGSGAAAQGGRVLLTGGEGLPASTRQELLRLRPARVVVVGGRGVVGDAVLAELRDLGVATVLRLSGPTRYETAVAVSRHVFPDGAPTVHVASGATWPDALAATPAAAAAGGPVLLTQADRLPEAVAAELGRLSPDTLVVVGGPSAVHDPTFGALRPLAPQTSRVSGPTRYDTAAAVAGRRPSAAGALLVTGRDFPDALAAGPVAARLGLDLLLVQQDALPGSTAALLDRRGPGQRLVIGGRSAVHESVLETVEDLSRSG